MLSEFLTFANVDATLVIEADRVVNEVRAEAGVQGRGCPLAGVIADHIFTR